MSIAGMAVLSISPSVLALSSSSSTPSSSRSSNSAGAARVGGDVQVVVDCNAANGSDNDNNNDDDDADDGGGWTDVAIKAAKHFTVSQREKLQREGVLGVSRPISIVGCFNNGLGAAVCVDDPVTDASEKIPYKAAGTTTKTTITKTIHFQRHGQGYHNLICDMLRERNQPIDFESTDNPMLNPMLRMEFLDPPLTHSGILQSRAAAKRRTSNRRGGDSPPFAESWVSTPEIAPHLIIVSPLLRCLQTAQYTFGGGGGGGNDKYSWTKIPWIAHEGCREELGLLVGNKRRRRSEIMADYPHVDFSHVVHEDDVLWDSLQGQKESLLEQSERIYKFLTEFVAQRPEPEIAIVSHSAYLFTMLNAVVDIQDEALKSWFLTSEVRTIQLQFAENPHYVDPTE